MIRSTSLAAVGLLVAALAAAIGIEERRLTTERSKAAMAELSAVNINAARDSTMNVAVDSLHTTASAPSIVDGAHGVRRPIFDLRQPPYALAAAVEIREQLDSARLDVQVTLDPIHLAARVTCSAPNDQGIRSATIVAMTPPWASVHFDRVEQSPELCASPALLRATRSHRLLGFPSLVFGGGRVVNSAGNGSWGLFVGIGAKLWG